jgi:hypothetical protein
MLLTKVNLKALSDFTTATVKFISDFLISQTNELLCKLIAYNITVLINAMHELKVKSSLISEKKYSK